MANRLNVPPELKSLIEKRERVERRASDRRSDQLDANDDAQGEETSLDVGDSETDARQAARRKKPRRRDP